MPSDRVDLSGSFVPLAKSYVEKLDETVEVVSVDSEVVEVVVDVDPLLSRVVVDAVCKLVDVDPLDNIVAAPAAMTHRSDNPAPHMEPVSLIFIFATPAY
ncbi:hypothetical protein TomTYG75_01690 [Sphingobium sp. TomTYG75]